MNSRYLAVFFNHTNTLISVWVLASDKAAVRAKLERTYGVSRFLIIAECATGSRDESAVVAKWNPVAA